MNELRELLERMIGGEKDYFRSLVMGSDPNTFAVNLDEAEEVPAVGCLVSRSVVSDSVGKPCYQFSLFFVTKRDEDADSETWELQQEELAKELHCFCAKLRPYVWRYPTTFNHWSDHALVGYWCDFTASATLLSECIDCEPTPPGRFYDYLSAKNGTDNYNIFLFNNLFIFEGLTLEFRYWCSNNSQNYAYALRYGASVRYPSTTIPANRVYDARYENIGAVTPITFTDVATGEVVAETTSSSNFGNSRYNGYLALWFMRTQNNTNTQRIYYIKIWRGEALLHDYRPYVTGDGVVGLKDVITGDFQAPQVNVSIVAMDDA